jgi:phosphoribosyl 1,2-cyclic phosphate phosphodiesterase
MILTFLGTGGAWGLPELDCDCMICREMRRRQERRKRTSLLLSGKSNILVDCGPDAASQLSEHGADKPDAVLITHEHGDHYLGLDELFAYKRNSPRGEFDPIPLYLTARSWEVIGRRFGYLEDMQVVRVHKVEPGIPFVLGEFEITPFKTNHGSFALGSVGFIVVTRDAHGAPVRLVYTSDFDGLPETPPGLISPDYLIIQAFWLNEPQRNIPHHMSFQRAIEFIRAWQPKRETFLVHMGDGDCIPGDRANRMLKKRRPLDPMISPEGEPYPAPRNQEEWDKTVARILRDRKLNYTVKVAYDGMTLTI